MAIVACAPVSPTPSDIERFVGTPRAVLSQAFDQAATDRGYSSTAGTYQRVLQYRRDPVLGIVKISDDPVHAIVLRPEIVAAGDSAARLKLAPQRLLWLWPYADRRLDYWTPGAPEYAEAVAIVDAAVARALSASREHAAQPASAR